MQAIFQFTRSTSLWIALAIVALIVVIAIARRIILPRLTQTLLLVGIVLLALAVASPVWNRSTRPHVAVMVDVSPSTRGASWYDNRWLTTRVAQLVGANEFQLYQFSAADNQPAAVDARCVETPADKTVFAPPPADSVLLFSDCRFDLPPSAPPTFIAVDPALESVSDGAIAQLDENGNDLTIVVRNQISGDAGEKPRQLAVTGVQSSADLPVGENLGAGTFVFHAKVDASQSNIVASVTGGDRWPENDELQLAAPTDPARAQRWWIHRDPPDRAAPDPSWRSISAGAVPRDSAEYLFASIVVLDDVPADDLPPIAQIRLEQFVRDLGGTLVIVGGDHSFGAGGYSGTTLNAISPLSSDPPSPRRHWIFLLDGSGSMATALTPTRTRWQVAVDALRNALPRLSPNDPISIGIFSDAIRWPSFAKTLAETMQSIEPLANVAPRGPTNLQPALDQLVSKLTGDLPVELLVISDADATIDDPTALASRLKSAHVRVNLLAIADLAASNPVAQLVSATGGTISRETDPAHWTAALRNLIRAASPDPIKQSHVTATFNFTPLSDEIDRYNITWPTKEANPLATARDGDQTVTLAAQRAFGLGDVIAVAFRASGSEIAAIENKFARMPIDPRFKIAWEIGPMLHLRIDAANPDGTYLNDLRPRLVLSYEGVIAQTSELPQTAPGRYELSIPAPRSPAIATVQLDNRVIARAALAGRYAAEFDAVGNDHAAMRALAQRTGGAIVDPSQTQAIQFPSSRKTIALTPILAFVGCALIALGIIHWRRSVT